MPMSTKSSTETCLVTRRTLGLDLASVAALVDRGMTVLEAGLGVVEDDD